MAFRKRMMSWLGNTKRRMFHLFNKRIRQSPRIVADQGLPHFEEAVQENSKSNVAPFPEAVPPSEPKSPAHEDMLSQQPTTTEYESTSAVLRNDDSPSEHPRETEETDAPQGISDAMEMVAALRAATADQDGLKSILTNVFIECSASDQFTDDLMLSLMKIPEEGRSIDSELFSILEVTKISPTKWKVDRDIELRLNAGDMVLLAHSMDAETQYGTVTFVEEIIQLSTMMGEGFPLDLPFAMSDGLDVNLTIIFSVAQESFRPTEELQKDLVKNHFEASLKRILDGTADLDDIDQTLIIMREPTVNDGGDAAIHAQAHHAMGAAYDRRFALSHQLDDLDRAITSYTNAVGASSDPDVVVKGSWLNALANCHIERFDLTRMTTDIDNAISYQQRALESAPNGDSNHPHALYGLGRAYLSRAEHTKELADIDYAIFYFKSSASASDKSSRIWPLVLGIVGTAYARRYEMSAKLSDINEAISYHRKAAESVKVAEPGRVQRLAQELANLGNSLNLRFENTRDLQDITSCISYLEEALQLLPTGHPMLATVHGNMGHAYAHRYEYAAETSETEDDLNQAIFHHFKSVESTPEGQAAQAERLTNLARVYRVKYDRSEEQTAMEQSISCYREAATKDGGPPSIRMSAARNAALLAALHDKSHCLDDFSTAINLLSQVVGLEQTIGRRHKSLEDHSILVTLAASYAFEFERIDLAIEWLEHGRCLIWNQINQLRIPPDIERLHMCHPSLAEQFTQIASALDASSSRPTALVPLITQNLPQEELLRQEETHLHTSLAAQYQQLLAEIRKDEDFRDFLRPPTCDSILSSLPPDGPIVIFSIGMNRCDAVILRAGMGEKSLHVHLNRFTFSRAEELHSQLHTYLAERQRQVDEKRGAQLVGLDFNPKPESMSDILEELWRDVAKPIIKALGHSTKFPPDQSARRRIWWCPSGPLIFLPIHAAGVYGSKYVPGSCVSDFVVSSYSPAIRSLKAGNQSDSFGPGYSNGSASVLMISQPNTPGLSPIPATRIETQKLKAKMDAVNVPNFLLADSDATVEEVKRQMDKHNIVHFACHGIQDRRDPLQSGLCLHDGRLELLDVIRSRNLGSRDENAKTDPLSPSIGMDLAFLSACQTGKGDVKLSEEVVHLAAGMLAVGYRCVVGTMWSISDQYGPDFAVEFYEHLLGGVGLELGKDKGILQNRIDLSKAAYALDYATKQIRERLRDEKSDALMTWVPYVHFGF